MTVVRRKDSNIKAGKKRSCGWQCHESTQRTRWRFNSVYFEKM